MSAIALPRRRTTILDDVIAWAFGVATVVTNKGKAMFADRLRTSPGTYTTSPKWVAMGIGAHLAARTAVAADTALSNEKMTRIEGTESVETTSVTNDTYKVTAPQTATEALAIDEAALFDAVSSGNMFASATLETDNLSTGDSITWTWKVKQS